MGPAQNKGPWRSHEIRQGKGFPEGGRKILVSPEYLLFPIHLRRVLQGEADMGPEALGVRADAETESGTLVAGRYKG